MILPDFIRWCDFRGVLGVREGFLIEDLERLALKHLIPTFDADFAPLPFPTGPKSSTTPPMTGPTCRPKSSTTPPMTAPAHRKSGTKPPTTGPTCPRKRAAGSSGGFSSTRCA